MGIMLRNLSPCSTIFIQMEDVIVDTLYSNKRICNDIDLTRIIYQSFHIIIALKQVLLAPMLSFFVC